MFTQNFSRLWVVFILVIAISSCQKKHDLAATDKAMARTNESKGHLKQTKTFSSDVVLSWLQQQLNMFRLPLATGASAPSSDRAFAYAGIALYEAVVPGMPAYRSLGGQLNDFPRMPSTKPGVAYHWAASANAALAAINRNLFAGASAENQILMNQLEASLEEQFAAEVDGPTLQRSIHFGRAVAQAVWAWAQSDGTGSMPPPSSYSLQTGPGLWEKTPPAFANPANAFHHMRRQMVQGSREGASSPALPFPFSTDPSSDYYRMVKEVFDTASNLSTEQRDIALYHREGLGYGGGSSIAGQLAAAISTAQATLDLSALAFAKVGIGTYEALTLTFIQKYEYLVMRPITFIRNYMGHTGWNTLYGTPPYPEYPAGHPTNGGMLAVMLTDVFGENFSFDVDYYGYLGQPARHYDSFDAMAHEMAIARFYAGIHYKPAVYAGLQVGKKVARNILTGLEFHK